MLEVARAAAAPETKVGATMKKLAAGVIGALGETRELGPARPLAREGGVVLVPREANRSYRPAEARALAAALLRAADEADGMLDSHVEARNARAV